MIALFFALGLWGLLEFFIGHREAFWPFFAVALFAPAAGWWISRRIQGAILAFFAAAVPSAFVMLFSGGALSSHLLAFGAGCFFFGFLETLRRGLFHGTALFSFVTFLGFLFLLLSAYAVLHMPALMLVGAVWGGAALFLFLSHSLLLDLGFWLKVRLVYFSLIVGAVIAELAWAVSQLPFHILNMDVLLGVVYYALWDGTYRYFSLRFTKRALLVDAIAVCAGIGALFVSARLLPSF